MAKPEDKTTNPTGDGTGRDDPPPAWYERPGRDANLMRCFNSFDEMRAYFDNEKTQVIQDLQDRLRRAAEAEAWNAPDLGQQPDQRRADEPPDGLGQRGGSEYSESNINDSLGAVFCQIVKPVANFIDPATREIQSKYNGAVDIWIKSPTNSCQKLWVVKIF